jgi:signal transduction histidine kinase
VKNNGGINHRLWQAFLLQALMISVAALAGVFAARYVLGDILIKRALEDEAGHFWTRFDADADASRPSTYNLTGYLLPDDKESMPAKFAHMDVGFYELDDKDSDFYIVYGTAHMDKKLLLVFAGQQVAELALFFGMFPLAGLLIVIYLSIWLSYRFSSRAVSPIIKLSRDVESLDPGSADFATELKMVLSDYTNTDHDVRTLSVALSRLSDQIEAFMLRERNFTRDASHELRSPITVIKIAADLLLTDGNLGSTSRRTVERIKTNASDMEELIQALLLLARESDNALSMDTVCVNDVVREEMERTQELLNGKRIQVSFQSSEDLTIKASDKVVSVMIGNLIRNAYSYTDEGRVQIVIEKNRLSICDSGIGMSNDDIELMYKPFHRGQNKKRGGYGVGLTIVKMLSERFHWPIVIESELNKGTTVIVSFPTENMEENTKAVN